MLYDYCRKAKVNYRKCGKWVVAVNPSEMDSLMKIKQNALESGVLEVRMLTRKEIDLLAEPHLNAYGVLLSPESGIVDGHSLIQSLEALGRSRGVEIAMQHSVKNLTKNLNGNYLVEIVTADGESIEVETETVVNCAGLNSDRVAELILKEKMPKDYRLYQSKGYYFAYRGPRLLDSYRLIYPLPEKGLRTLGVHLTIDLNNRIKFGPDKHYIERFDIPNDSFPVDPYELFELKSSFLNSIQRYFPGITESQLHPDYSGIRPTRASPTDTTFKDFIIAEESDKGFPRLVNLIGIESPGLTSSLAIAERVASLLGYEELDHVEL